MIAPWISAALGSGTTVLASTGFWTYVLRRDSKKSATTRLLMGLGYSEIVKVGFTYIDRGWVTKDEYEDFRKYFYEPYVALGGNGVAERIMREVSSLPFQTQSKYSKIVRVKSENRETHDDASSER